MTRKELQKLAGALETLADAQEVSSKQLRKIAEILIIEDARLEVKL